MNIVKRLLARSLGLYLLFAVIGRFVERIGAVECGCSPDCWCKRPVLKHVPVGLSSWSPLTGHLPFGKCRYRATTRRLARQRTEPAARMALLLSTGGPVGWQRAG